MESRKLGPVVGLGNICEGDAGVVKDVVGPSGDAQRGRRNRCDARRELEEDESSSWCAGARKVERRLAEVEDAKTIAVLLLYLKQRRR